jgi:hypothetical protein
VTVRLEVDGKRQRGQGPGNEPGEPLHSGRREEERTEARDPDRTGNPSELGCHPRGLTITRASAVWPSTVTTRR